MHFGYKSLFLYFLACVFIFPVLLIYIFLLFCLLLFFFRYLYMNKIHLRKNNYTLQCKNKCRPFFSSASPLLSLYCMKSYRLIAVGLWLPIIRSMMRAISPGAILIPSSIQLTSISRSPAAQNRLPYLSCSPNSCAPKHRSLMPAHNSSISHGAPCSLASILAISRLSSRYSSTRTSSG